MSMGHFYKENVKFIRRHKVLRNKDKIHDAFSYTIIIIVLTHRIGLLPRFLNTMKNIGRVVSKKI